MNLSIIVLLTMLNHGYGYYYHYDTQKGLILVSLTRDPIPGFRLLRPPKANRNNNGKAATPGSCRPDLGFRCPRRPFPASETSQFECDADYQCPEGHKCCPQRCFAHGVCSPVRDLAQEDFRMKFRRPPIETTTIEDADKIREYEAYEYHYGDGPEEEEYFV